MERSEREALELLRQGLSDERVERITHLSLLGIIELRAGLASAPALRRPDDAGTADPTAASIATGPA